MGILDRPLFQRRLTTNQLRGYGLPAFANGGIVQKFQTLILNYRRGKFVYHH